MALRTVRRVEPLALRREMPGDRIVRARLARSWTQAELAERAAISQMTVYRAESGRNVYAWVLAAIAEALDTTMDALWHGEEGAP